MRIPLTPITLGTVQFGLQYGIVNDSGCPNDAEIADILAVAQTAGIRYFDSARAYGNAEARLGMFAEGKRWGRITKIAPLEPFMRDRDIRDAGVAVAASVRESQTALRTDFLDIVMFHRPADAGVAGTVDALQAEIAAGRVGAAGVSVYTPEEAVNCLRDPRLQHIQIPFNLVDGRWLQDDFQQALARRPDATIHARSAFLQGLLLNSAARWPNWVDNAAEIGRMLDLLVDELDCTSRAELCLRYNASTSWITTTVVGVDTAKHLETIANIDLEAKFPAAGLAKIAGVAALAAPRLLNPALW